MANEEALVLDGVALNDGVTLGMVSLSAPPPRERQEWIGAADSETQLLVRKPLHENRKVTARLVVLPQASMDLAHDKIALVVDKLAKASKYTDGITLTWTPATGTRTVTFDVLSGEITDLPIDWESGWLSKSPEFTVELTAQPYWRGVDCTTVSDAFAANSIADYTFDAGAAGNVSITGGVMDAVANLTAENRLLHTASPYNMYSVQVTAKHTLGTTLSSYKAGVILKRVDASNYLEVYVDDTGAASRLRIDKVLAGVRTNLSSTALTRMTVSTAYWVRGRIEGNVVVAEHWTSAPTVTGTAASSGTTTLAGGDATALGSGVGGRSGLVWIPQQTAATLDDLEIAPNVFVSATPIVTGEIAGVSGDIPGRAVAIVTDSATQSRRHVEWGLEGLYYNSATALILDSDSLVISGFAGSGATTTGAYDPNASGSNVVFANIYRGVPIAVCGTGNLSHVGTFRVKARMQATAGTQVRLAWRAGDGPLSSNPWVTISAEATWVEVDLGTIIVPPAVVGSQRWTGQIEALNTGLSGGVHVDYLLFVPALEGYGKARAQYAPVSGTTAAFDNFLSTTAGNTLGTRSAPLGGSWATSGDATDFAFNDNLVTTPNDGVETIIRSTTAAETTGRFAVLGSTNYTDTQIDARIKWSSQNGGSDMALVARWTDSSNHLRLVVSSSGASGTKIEQVIAGVGTTLASSSLYASVFQAVYRVRLVAFASGRVIGQLMNDSGSVLLEMDAIASALATGGTLQTGKPAFRDKSNSDTAFRRMTAFAVSTPAPEPIVLYSGRNIQIRYDDVLRQDSAGTYSGRPPSYRGSRFLVPVGTSRVLVKARRNDIEATGDANVTDATQVQVIWAPRGLVIPR